MSPHVCEREVVETSQRSMILYRVTTPTHSVERVQQYNRINCISKRPPDFVRFEKSGTNRPIEPVHVVHSYHYTYEYVHEHRKTGKQQTIREQR